MNYTAHVSEIVRDRFLEIDVHGKLGREDYEKFVPDLEQMIQQHGKIRILVTMHDFHGWDAGALVEDIKWNAKHLDHIERLAIVGEKTWHRFMTGFCKPFTTALVRYFAPGETLDARIWVGED